MPDTPLPSECDDSISIAECVPLRSDSSYDSCISDPYNVKSSPLRRQSLKSSDSATLLPRIIITPTPEDNQNRFENVDYTAEKPSNQSDTFELLSSKLNQFYRNDTGTKTIEDNNKLAFNDDWSARNSSSPHTTISKTSSDKILVHSQELDSSQSESDSESETTHSSSQKLDESESAAASPAAVYDRQRNDSLFEIEDIQELEMHSDDDESADIIEFIIDNSDHMSNCDTVEFDDHLSVIFEEDENSHSRRRKFDSMCSSNSSATLANDENHSKQFDSDDAHDEHDEAVDSVEHEDDEEEEEDDSSSTVESDNESAHETDNESTDDEADQSTSVTVRLPLRFSFSRSSNDEEVTTVLVGKSEIKVEENIPACKTPALNDSIPDVSVSFSLRPKSRPSISQQSSVDTSNTKSFDNDDNSEVSVSVSLPLRRHRTMSPAPIASRRPVFMRQQTLSPVPYDKDEFEYKRWDRGFTVERDTAVQRPKDYNNVQPDDVISVRDTIKAFETIVNSKKEDFHRQDACTSFDEPINEAEEEEEKLNNEPFYTNLPQNEKPSNEYSADVEVHNTVTPHYQSYIADQYPQQQVELIREYPEFVFPEEYTDANVEEVGNNCEVENNIEVDGNLMQNMKQENGVEEEIRTHKVDKANLSIHEKIASFEQPESYQPMKIDARREITELRERSVLRERSIGREKSVPREINESESIGNRFLAQINPSLAQSQTTQNTETKYTVEPQPNETTTKPNKTNYMQRSIVEESELEETDSGVDIHRRVSEDIDTESECYSELRKLTRYERAATHSRLFKLLQEYDTEASDTEKSKIDEDVQPSFSRPKRIVHNVSITRKQNPELVKQAETMSERRERLHLNYNSTSIDTDNPSSSASPSCASPTSSVNEKLVDELVHSVLQQTKRRNLRNIPLEKIQAAARRALLQQQEENDSCDTFSSFDSTPALTPQEFHDDYYDSDPDRNSDIFPSKAFKHLQEQSTYGRKNKLWAARCPRVLSSKTVNSDLGRVTETRESQSPERDQHYAYPY